LRLGDKIKKEERTKKKRNRMKIYWSALLYRATINSNISSRCLHNMTNFGPLVAEIGSGDWGIPANFSGV